MSKEEILDTLENFKDEYGTSFSNAEPQAMSVIEDALDLYFVRLFPQPLSHQHDPTKHASGCKEYEIDEYIKHLAPKSLIGKKED